VLVVGRDKVGECVELGLECALGSLEGTLSGSHGTTEGSLLASFDGVLRCVRLVDLPVQSLGGSREGLAAERR